MELKMNNRNRRDTASLNAENVALRPEVARLRVRIAELEAPPLALILGKTFSDPFRAADAWADAEAQAAEAESEGRTIPELPAALAAAGICDPNALGRWIGKSPLFEKCGSEGGKTIWVRRMG